MPGCDNGRYVISKATYFLTYAAFDLLRLYQRSMFTLDGSRSPLLENTIFAIAAEMPKETRKSAGV